MRPVLFAGLDLAGAALWSTVIGLTGWAIEGSVEMLVRDVRRHEGAIALGLLVVVLVILSFRGRDYGGAVVAEKLLITHEVGNSGTGGAS
jgi:membrane protein DedA with SNARE-associated domain